MLHHVPDGLGLPLLVPDGLLFHEAEDLPCVAHPLAALQGDDLHEILGEDGLHHDGHLRDFAHDPLRGALHVDAEAHARGDDGVALLHVLVTHDLPHEVEETVVP